MAEVSGATETAAGVPGAIPNVQTPLLEAKGVSKAYGHVQALIDVDFDIQQHEVVGLLGDNGAGKSTLIKILSGVVAPDQGEFLRAGQRATINSRRASEKLGVETIYQDIALVGSMSIMRNIFAGRELVNGLGFLRMSDMRRTTMDVLEQHVRIAGITSPDLMVEELSGGQQQAVAIARAVHFKHDMLLLDEPTSALSVRETEKVLSYMTELATSGVSCVFVTHNIYQAYNVCNRFVVMAHGRVIKNVMKEETSMEELSNLIIHN